MGGSANPRSPEWVIAEVALPAKNPPTMRALLAATTVCIGGCASYDMLQAPPGVAETVAVSVSTAAKGNPNFVQIYPIPASSTFIVASLNAQPGAAQAAGAMGAAGGAVGGMAGLAVAAAGFSEAKEAIRLAIAGSEQNLTVDMAALTRPILEERINTLGAQRELQLGTGGPAKGVPSLSLLPYVVMAFVSRTEARPFVFVDATLNDARGSEIWEARYIGTTTQARTLVGSNGWTAESGRAFRAAVDEAAAHALTVAVRDFSGRLSRSDARDAVVRTRLAAMADLPTEWRARVIESNDKTLVLVTKAAGGPWFGGVYNIPRELVERW